MNKTAKFFVLSITSLTPLTTIAAVNTELGTVNLDFRLRLETVNQDNSLENSKALTLRTKANFETNLLNGFYGFAELENSSILIDNFNNTLGTGRNFSVVADPATTELDQAYLGYKTEKLSVKIGRQVITMDNHRHVGHVGWRQDKQTFDALSVTHQVNDKFNASYAYINKRNRIFSDRKDVDSKDHLINIELKTSLAAITGYAYFLEVDDNTENAIDTFGLRLNGNRGVISYTGEIAVQTIEKGTQEYDMSYVLAELGTKVGGYKLMVGYESLGSDNGNSAFSTPLATLHKFNGWADQFLATPDLGLNDFYVSLAGKLGPGKLMAAYHNYSTDSSIAGNDDFGSEINLQYAIKLSPEMPFGVKYAGYEAGDANLGKVDTNKLWLWAGYSF